MACLSLGAVLIVLLLLPVARGVRREIARTGNTFPALIAVFLAITLFLLAGLIFLSKFRFER